jgi:hypothetical protein
MPPLFKNLLSSSYMSYIQIIPSLKQAWQNYPSSPTITELVSKKIPKGSHWPSDVSCRENIAVARQGALAKSSKCPFWNPCKPVQSKGSSCPLSQELPSLGFCQRGERKWKGKLFSTRSLSDLPWRKVHSLTEWRNIPGRPGCRRLEDDKRECLKKYHCKAPGDQVH